MDASVTDRGKDRGQRMACPACLGWGSLLTPQPDGAIYRCPACRLEFAAVDHSAFVPVRDNRYIQPQSIPDPATYEPYVEFFGYLGARFGDRRLKVLDVGCGNGVFLGECLRRGHDPHGVEADEDMRRIMNPDLARRVDFSRVEECRLPPEAFDAITFWDSFEHLEQAFPVLSVVGRALAPEGMMLLRVNNNHDVYNLTSRFLLRVVPSLGRVVHRRCFDFPRHRWNFSVPAMRHMLDREGWEVLRVDVGETPADRLTGNPLLALAIRAAYWANRRIGGGKIGSYYIARQP